MSDRKWGFALLSLFLLAMPRVARAATFTVDNTLDGGMGSLRDAINNANTLPTAANTINFTVSGTITLGSALPGIANTSPGSLTIDGSGQAITVDGANSFQIFTVNSGATLNLKQLTLAHGSANNGGAIFSAGKLSITNSTLANNHAIAGGAIDVVAPGELTVTNSTFSGNESRPSGGILGAGGAIISISGIVSVSGSTFSDNHAFGGFGNPGFGGAISNLRDPINHGRATIINSTFVDNQADVGGAIFNTDQMSVTNSTFSDNQANVGSGGAIDNTGTTSLKGSILTASAGGNCGSIVAVNDAGYNISDDGSCGFVSPSLNNSTTLNLDPAGLANNGGPTETIALEPNSQAIDFIPVASCTDQSSPTPMPVTTDQRGLPRPDPGNPNFCDAGAFELQTVPFVLVPNSERVQIARSSNPDSDQVNMAFTFTENGFPMCDAGDDAFNGFSVLLRSGSCGALDDASLDLDLEPWVVHTVNHLSYGSIFQSTPPETVSARMVQLPTPASPACGEWTVNIEVAGFDSTDLGNGPFALVLTNPDGDQGCFDITNAIVGGQLPTPGRRVRRRVRR